MTTFNVNGFNDTGNITLDENTSNFTKGVQSGQTGGISVETAITIYSTIFVLAVIGNGLVILTLVQNKRMRTVTNVFLLNLAVSDLLLAVFCMPFTLIPILIRNFIFGPFICISIRYLQGVSVGASCFTLVSISLERYFAICRPLRSRQWQTLSHAYKIIAAGWILSAIIMIPIGVSTRHVTLAPGRFRCREFWFNEDLERAYTVFLDVFLLLIPLFLMTGAYIKIMCTLCTGMELDEPTNGYVNGNGKRMMSEVISLKSTNIRSYVFNGKHNSSPLLYGKNANFRNDVTDSPCSSEESTPRKKLDRQRTKMRHTNYEKCRTAKLRVIKMLFVVVIEFFVCWAPLYSVQTWRSFHVQSMVQKVSITTWSVMFLLSYLSSCCNPITYCFMNKRFRQSFIAALRCFVCCSKFSRLTRHLSLTSKRTSTKNLTWLDDSVAEKRSTVVEL